MRQLLIILSIMMLPVASAHAAGDQPAHVSVGIRLHNVSIGINMPAYPSLVLVPGYPVYYAPHVDANYFFYDGMYWIFHDDNWYVSVWYNGPWDLVSYDYVPVFILRIPVRYYRHPPAYFHGWRYDEPPRWGEHWGRDWEHRHSGWDQWDHHYAPKAAPLPNYQRNYSGDRYPHTQDQQRTLRTENYRYEPQENITRQRYQQYSQPGQPRQDQQRYQQPQQYQQQQQYQQKQQEQSRPQYQQQPQYEQRQPSQEQQRYQQPQQQYQQPQPYRSQPQYEQRQPSQQQQQQQQQQKQQDQSRPQYQQPQQQQYPQKWQYPQQQRPAYEPQGKGQQDHGQDRGQQDRGQSQGGDKGKKYDDRDQGHGNPNAPYH